MKKIVPEGGAKLDPKKTKLPPLLRVQLKSDVCHVKLNTLPFIIYGRGGMNGKFSILNLPHTPSLKILGAPKFRENTSQAPVHLPL